ncbi:MAG: hemolysin family protein [Alphaproteobacteria bacterium]
MKLATRIQISDSVSEQSSPEKTTDAPAFNSSGAESNPSFGQSFRSWLRRLVGGKPDGSLKEALEEVIEEREEQGDITLPPEEKVILHNVLSFGDIKVSDIMVPRTDIAAVPSDITLDALKAHIIDQRHTRIPVYDGTMDKMQGFLHVKDLLPMLSCDVPYDIRTVMRSLLFVPASMRIMDLLVRMRHAGSHMAIVVDEYGGSDGLVTMEDVFEEIVGDIQDEHDEDEVLAEEIYRINEKTYEVNARIRVDKLEQELGLNLITEEKKDDFDTLGGLIFFQLGRVPVKGEMIPHVSGIRFEITEADMRRIRRVRIHTS